MRKDFGAGANSVETAVANASRVLPLLTSAHLPSASNHSFWPELYTNMPVVLGSERSPYSDTPNPKCFGTVSPLDPQLFSTVVEHAADLLAGRADPKYSPVEMAQWLDDCSAAASQALAKAGKEMGSNASPEFRRIQEDVLIQNGLGQFFAAKLRSGVLYEIYQETGDPDAGKLALGQYRKARDCWAAMAKRAQTIYGSNITYGDVPIREGHWIGRLPDINKDVTAMEAALQSKSNPQGSSPEKAQRAVRAVTQRTHRPSIPCSHTPQAAFQPGQSLSVALRMSDLSAHESPSSVLLYYRHVNQGERWRSLEMERAKYMFRSSIPGEYTNSAFPLQYYFELRRRSSEAWFYPAFNATFSNQPYFAIYKRKA